MLMTKLAKTVANISKLSPTHLVSNIRNQHRCNLTYLFSDSANQSPIPNDNSKTTKCITIVEISSARPIINGRWIIPPRTSSKVGQSSSLPLSGSSGGPQLRNKPPCIDKFFLNQNIHSLSRQRSRYSIRLTS